MTKGPGDGPFVFILFYFILVRRVLYRTSKDWCGSEGRRRRRRRSRREKGKKKKKKEKRKKRKKYSLGI